jgi:glycosyltransferase involved in cell wall biosynthesis
VIHIGVDAWNLPGDRRGIGRYLRSILDAWARTATGRVRVTLVVPERWTGFAASRYLCELGGRSYPLRSRSALRAQEFDALWFPFNGPSWNDRFAGPGIATLHDASTFVLPGFGDDARATFRLAATRCVQILTDSAFAAEELQRELSLPPEAISAIPLGVAPARPAGPSAVDPKQYGRFVLCVGGTEPRKNFATLFAALRRLPGDAALTLVHAGTPTSPFPPAAGVRFAALGHVDDDTLAALYRACTVFAYPSLYEGFGLPILEAMSYGAPVVAARSSSLPEAGGDAAAYVEPLDEAGFAAAFLRIADDERFAADLRARGLARAAEFTWERAAEATLAAFEKAVAKGERTWTRQ